MKALKVMYRGPKEESVPDCVIPAESGAGFVYEGKKRLDYDALYSAIPTPQALRYYEGEKTTPETGKLMVFLNNQAKLAREFCYMAGDWYRYSDIAVYGTIEIWRAECRNLYRIYYLIPPRAVVFDGSHMDAVELFWRIVWAGRDPRGEVWDAKKSLHQLWTTDSVIPEECLAVYAIRPRRWRKELEGQR